MKRLLRATLRLLLEVFFGELDVVGGDRIPTGRPVMLCPNHPSAGMDAMLMGAVFGEKVHYLAKAPLFRNPLAGAFLRWLGGIPVYRKQDAGTATATPAAAAPGAAGAPGAKNVEAFAAAHRVLREKGWLALFPEGTSMDTPRLLPLKTGAARIALEVEEEASFTLGVVIVPVGLAYSAPTDFRSRVVVSVGEPIEARDYRERYERDPQEAVRALTAALERGIRRELAYVPEEPLASLAEAIAIIYESEGKMGADAPSRRAAREAVRDALHHYAESDPARVVVAQDALSRYMRKIERLSLSDRVVARAGRPPLSSTRLLVELVLGFPAALYGYLNHMLPYNVPRLVVSLLSPNPTDVSSIKLATGSLAFLTSYALQCWGAFRLLPPELAALYVASLPVTGVLALRWASLYELARDTFPALQGIAGRRREAVLEQLGRERRRILEMLEAARRELEQVRLAKS